MFKDYGSGFGVEGLVFWCGVVWGFGFGFFAFRVWDFGIWLWVYRV